MLRFLTCAGFLVAISVNVMSVLRPGHLVPLNDLIGSLIIRVAEFAPEIGVIYGYKPSGITAVTVSLLCLLFIYIANVASAVARLGDACVREDLEMRYWERIYPACAAVSLMRVVEVMSSGSKFGDAMRHYPEKVNLAAWIVGIGDVKTRGVLGIALVCIMFGVLFLNGIVGAAAEGRFILPLGYEFSIFVKMYLGISLIAHGVLMCIACAYVIMRPMSEL